MSFEKVKTFLRDNPNSKSSVTIKLHDKNVVIRVKGFATNLEELAKNAIVNGAFIRTETKCDKCTIIERKKINGTDAMFSILALA